MKVVGPKIKTNRGLRALGRAAAAIPGIALVLVSFACPPPPPSPPLPNTFDVQITPILERHCTQCHGATNPGAGLVLTADRALANLVGVSSTQVPSMKLVEPGLPDKSYLVFKITGRQGEVGGSGDQMPKTQLSDEEITRLQDWIVGGAK